MAASVSIDTPSTGGSDPSSDTNLRYRAHLDGLRAIAVYLVLLFHAGWERFSGGFIGVDVFFVLSGYLVTQVLLRDLAGRGAVRLGRFYARRYRRLLPAAFVVLLITAAIYSAIASPSDALSSVNAFKAAFLYVSNWFFIYRSTAYFGGNIAQNPVLQFWSLAVEEQFYLIWPLALAGLFAITRRRGPAQRNTVVVVVGVAAAASLAWALYLRTGSPQHAYFGTDTRAYQLLAGALLALSPGIITRVAGLGRRASILSAVSLAALLFLATSWVHFDAIARGVAVTVVTLALIIGIEASERSAVKRMLSTAPAVYLGKISYGTYLWHWPVILVIAQLLHLSTISTVAITALVATGLASLSFQILEQPVRASQLLDRHRRVVIASGLAISIVSALVFIPPILEPSSATADLRGNTTSSLTPVPSGLDFGHAVFSHLPKPPVCYGKDPSVCTIVHGTGRSLLLIGDSHARMLIPTFTELARKRNLTLSVISGGGCPWQQHLYTLVDTARCKREKDDAYARVIPALHPDVIVAINFGYDDPNRAAFPVVGANGKPVARGSAAFDTLLKTTTNESARALASHGRDLVLIEPVPRAGKLDPTSCLEHSKYLEPCRFVVSSAPTSAVRLYRKLAAKSPSIWSVNFDKLVCPFYPICDPVIAGRIVRVDQQHLTVDYATYIAPQVQSYLQANRLIARN